MGNDRVLMKTQLCRPGRGTCQKDDPPGLYGRQTTLATQCFREWLAQLTIERIQGARARDKRGDGSGFTDGLGGGIVLLGAFARLHDENSKRYRKHRCCENRYQ